jgi:YHS domain-containing protein
MNKFLKICFIWILLAGFSISMASDFVFTNDGYFGKGNKYAIEGYDTTAYLEQGKAVKGKKDISFKYKGAIWLFASNKTRALFEANPKKYAPIYGGNCAYAAAINDLSVYGDPKLWKIVDKKLYLNYDKEASDKWNKDIPVYIKKANSNWLKEFKNLN